MSVIKPQKQQQIQRSVGQTIGERRTNSQQPAQASNASVGTPARHKDSFHQNNAAKAQGLAGFASNATFRIARKFASDSPFKPAKVERLEQGTLSRSREVQPPSDDAMVRFLDRIIATEPEKPRARAAQLSQRPALNQSHNHNQKKV
jgi:hypothetical protein